MTEIRGPTFAQMSQAYAGGATPKVETGNVATQSTRGTVTSGADFAAKLDQAMTAPAPVKFSRHAEERIRSRGIAMTPADLDRLGRAVDAAAAKGSKDSLVVSNSLSFVVNVPSRTVVTAMPGSTRNDATQVFTKIDSAVLL